MGAEPMNKINALILVIALSLQAIIPLAYAGLPPVRIAPIGSTPNSGGATAVGNLVTLQPADASNGGVVSTGTQTFAGAKTFSNTVTLGAQLQSSTATASGTNAVALGYVEDNSNGGYITASGAGSLAGGYTKDQTIPAYCSDGAYTDQATCELNGETWNPAEPLTAKVEASGTGAFAWGGNDSFADGTISVTQTIASGNYSIAMGANARATAESAVAIGYNSQSNFLWATSVGPSNDNGAYQGTAVGSSNSLSATSDQGTAVGYGNAVNGYSSLASGYSNYASNDYTVSVGYQNVVNNTLGIAVGSNNIINADRSAAFGSSNQLTGSNSVVLGIQGLLTGNNSLLISNGSGIVGAYALDDSIGVINGKQTGRIELLAGPGSDGNNGGNVQITGGPSSSTGSGGNIILSGGTSSSGAGGGIYLTPGIGTAGAANGRIVIGASGTSLKKIVSGTASLNFPSISAGGTAELTISVPDAATNDAVTLGPPASLTAGLMAIGYVSSSGTVTVRVHNTTGSPIDPPAATWRAMVTVF